jgi:hypothetical protein
MINKSKKLYFMKERLLFIIAVFLIVASCSKSSTGGGGGNGGGGGGTTVNCSGVPSSFSTNVNPIIQATCATDATCHGSGSANGPGPLLTYAQISGAASLIKTAVSNGTMPKVGSLTTAQKNTIICWVNSGAPPN